jgi:hypothetical protein
MVVMDRRLVGTLMIVAVVAAAIIFPASNGKRIAGDAIAVELPSDPVVGDCLIMPGSDHPDGMGQVFRSRPSSDLTTESSSMPPPNRVDIGPCDGQPVVGEVVAMTTIGHGNAPLPGTSAVGKDCKSTALEYAGLIPHDKRFELSGDLTADPVNWNVSIDVLTSWVLPSPFLQSAGKKWAACVLAPARSNPYQGRVSAAYGGGQLPDEFASCWNSREVGPAAGPVPCDQPHLAELISVGAVPSSAATSPSAIQNSCDQLAAVVMRRPDPTASGALTVQTAPDSARMAQGLTSRFGTLNIVCYIVATRGSLTSTLVGLGNRPLPYAG